MKIFKEVLSYVIIIAIVVLIRIFVVTPVKVDGSSMYPTLKNNDIMILNKIKKIKRFDIVVINCDKVIDGQRKKNVLIKRVIGLPGETIEVRDGNIYINDKKIKDKYGFGKTSDFGKMKIPKGEYFVLGDNRSISADSRIFGTFTKKSIRGTTRFILFPFKHFGKVK